MNEMFVTDTETNQTLGKALCLLPEEKKAEILLKIKSLTNISDRQLRRHLQMKRSQIAQVHWFIYGKVLGIDAETFGKEQDLFFSLDNQGNIFPCNIEIVPI